VTNLSGPDFYETTAWKLGDSAQKQWARILAGKGRVVLPTYGMVEQDAESKAPMLFAMGGLLIAPDMLVMRPNFRSVWNEVKAKTSPSWRRIPPGPRWEHGCDWSLVLEYEKVQSQTGCHVWIVVQEVSSPRNPHDYTPLDGPLVWLGIALSTAMEVGDRRKDWPGGKCDPSRRGRRGMGGLLWDRAEMMNLTDKTDPA
jgi:hypothetical protein